jgi:hypothetical protein
MAFSQSIVIPDNLWLDSIFKNESGTYKLRDYKFEKLKYNNGTLSSTIRKFSTDNNPDVYCLIIHFTPPLESINYNAYFSYEQLIRLNTIISRLRDEVVPDFQLKPDYLENTMKKGDGNWVGYIIENDVIKWILRLRSTPTKFNDYEFSFEKEYITFFKRAQTKIESLMAGN